MAVTAKYKGGPLAGRKATIKGADKPPETIKAVAQARAKNMRPGIYMLVCSELAPTGAIFHYVWR